MSPVTNETVATGYAAARLIALAAPLDSPTDEPARARAETRLRECLGLDSATARRIATRCILFQRDRRLHETLVLQADPLELRSILDSVEFEGIDRLERSQRGRLLVSFHYGPYSSLLWLALAHAAAAKRIRPVTFALNHQLDPNLVMSPSRWDVLATHGVLHPEVTSWFDFAAGGVTAARDLAARLNVGGSLLILPDAWFVPQSARNAVTCRIGKRRIAFPGGAGWLARRSGCEVVAVRIQPSQNGHRIVFEPVETVMAAVDALGDVVAADPAPWEGWTRDQPYF